jgi:hypothetical protein
MLHDQQVWTSGAPDTNRLLNRVIELFRPGYPDEESPSTRGTAIWRQRDQALRGQLPIPGVSHER